MTTSAPHWSPADCSPLLYTLVNAGTVGWSSDQTIGLLGLGVALLAVFGWVESKVHSPLVPLRISRVAQVRGANIAMILMAAAMVGLFFILTLYLQDVAGYSAIKAGMASAPLGLVLIIIAGMSGPLTERLGVKPVLVSGLTLFTVGVAWMSQFSVNGSYLTDVFGPSLVIGVGLALAFVALTIGSVSGIEPENAGVAGGLINMTQQVGGAIGLAIITAVITGHVHGHVPSVTNLDVACREALRVAAIMGAAGVAIAAVVLPRRSRLAPITEIPTATALNAAHPAA